MMMVPYMFNEALMDDLFSNDWEHDFDRAMRPLRPAVCLANAPPM